jgi:hypothetical protein
LHGQVGEDHRVAGWVLELGRRANASALPTGTGEEREEEQRGPTGQGRRPPPIMPLMST